MQTLYSFAQFFNTLALNHPNIKTFTMGDIEDIDTAKQTLFPLCHLILNNTTIGINPIMTYNCTLLVMDIVAEITENSSGHFNSITKNYKGVTNLLDVWNTSQATLSDIVVYIQNNPQALDYNIETDVILTPFQQRFDNVLAGFGANLNIQVPYNPNSCLFTLSDIQAAGGIDGCN